MSRTLLSGSQSHDAQKKNARQNHNPSHKQPGGQGRRILPAGTRKTRPTPRRDTPRTRTQTGRPASQRNPKRGTAKPPRTQPEDPGTGTDRHQRRAARNRHNNRAHSDRDRQQHRTKPKPPPQTREPNRKAKTTTQEPEPQTRKQDTATHLHTKNTNKHETRQTRTGQFARSAAAQEPDATSRTRRKTPRPPRRSETVRDEAAVKPACFLRKALYWATRAACIASGDNNFCRESFFYRLQNFTGYRILPAIELEREKKNMLI